jgi:hypothetical protein
MKAHSDRYPPSQSQRLAVKRCHQGNEVHAEPGSAAALSSPGSCRGWLRGAKRKMIMIDMANLKAHRTASSLRLKKGQVPAPRTEVARRTFRTRRAVTQAAQPDRDHVWAAQGSVSGCPPRRQTPDGVPFSNAARSSRPGRGVNQRARSLKGRHRNLRKHQKHVQTMTSPLQNWQTSSACL